MKKVLILIIMAVSLASGAGDDKIATLMELKKTQEMIQKELDEKTILLKQSTQPDEKSRLTEEIKYLQNQNTEAKTMFENVASGIDETMNSNGSAEAARTLSEDFQLLLQPLIQQAKDSTEAMRKKARLKEEEERYSEQLSEAQKAVDNIAGLMGRDMNSTLHGDLMQLLEYWNKQAGILSGNLKATRHRIEALKGEEKPFGSSFEDGFRSFFHNQGRALLEALGAFVGVLVVMKIVSVVLIKLFPRMVDPHRTVSLRLIDLFLRILTVILAFLAPIQVFYYEENWLLASIGILLMIGVLWALKHLIPNLWQQSILLLNIGSVRENERINYRDLPWRVKSINIFTILENPDTLVQMRIPIAELIGLISKPVNNDEPWFPCRKSDWVVLGDGYFGKVVAISLEFIELVDLGGSRKTYNINDFLSLSPMNISTGFRLVNTIGISYKHQKESTAEAISKLESYIRRRIREEEYEESLGSLTVEFDSAGDSSLNLAVVTNFSGKMAPAYNRLRRAVNRWCVEACTLNGWEIPFPQLTVSTFSDTP